MLIAEQPVNGLDLMLHVRAASEVAPELRQRELPADQESLDDSHECRGACRVPDHFSTPKPA
ncbi:MAG: hypothetical protein HS104_03215 [Polyangiaceae bacterium]|nr:hypothetical protein [Polyangiaceae bacterium]